MAGTHRRPRPRQGPHHRAALALLATLTALALALGSAGIAPRNATAASTWDGSFDLYRSGTFTTQKSWLWCTAADVQIIRNIVDGQRDHSKRGQQRYFDWMRGHNRYDLPLSAGVDPAGWTAGLRQFVDDRYRLVSSGSFDAALRSAVQGMRATNLPVALAVSRGNHGWVLTGFSATADPATTEDFTITSVRVVGPLYGLQSRSYGYDMPPGTSLTTKQLRHFFTPWWYAPTRMIWDGRYVSIQPVEAPKPQIAVKPPLVVPSGPGPSASVEASASAGSSPDVMAAASAPPPTAEGPASSAAPAAADPPSAATLAPEPDTRSLDTLPTAELLGVPLIVIVAVAVVGASAILVLGLLARARRRPPQRIR